MRLLNSQKAFFFVCCLFCSPSSASIGCKFSYSHAIQATRVRFPLRSICTSYTFRSTHAFNRAFIFPAFPHCDHWHFPSSTLSNTSGGQTSTDVDCDRKIDDNCSARATIGLTTSSKRWSLAHDAETYQSDTAITLWGTAMNYSKAIQVRCQSKGTSLQRTILSYIGKKKSLSLQDFWYTFSKVKKTTQRKKAIRGMRWKVRRKIWHWYASNFYWEREHSYMV